MFKLVQAEMKTTPEMKKAVSQKKDQVLSMYAKGMTTTDIEKHLESIYRYSIEATSELIQG